MSSEDSVQHVLAETWQALVPSDDQTDGLFLGARVQSWRECAVRGRWVCVQPFKPEADALQQAGCTPLTEIPAAMRAGTVLVLPPRQRMLARVMLAQAVDAAAEGGRVVAAARNEEGARSLQGDLEALVGHVQHSSRRHCRVVWTTALAHARVDTAIRSEWLALDAIRPASEGQWSRPGLFAWDRIDTGSALLAASLPDDLSGDAADLGAGWGYLSGALLARCAGIRRLDLYEADARALPAARANLAACAHPAEVDVFWHDVTCGLPRAYDVIVSNPPFHTDRADRPELGQAFIASAAAALRAHGRFWLVANRHLPYESLLAARFAKVEQVTVAHGFKVLQAQEPRT